MMIIIITHSKVYYHEALTHQNMDGTEYLIHSFAKCVISLYFLRFNYKLLLLSLIDNNMNHEESPTNY